MLPWDTPNLLLDVYTNKFWLKVFLPSHTSNQASQSTELIREISQLKLDAKRAVIAAFVPLLCSSLSPTRKQKNISNEKVIVTGKGKTNSLIPRGSLKICSLICS